MTKLNAVHFDLLINERHAPREEKVTTVKFASPKILDFNEQTIQDDKPCTFPTHSPNYITLYPTRVTDAFIICADIDTGAQHK